MLTFLFGDHRTKIDAILEKKTQKEKNEGTYRRHIGDVKVVEIDPYFTESLFGEIYAVVFDGLSLFPEETQAFLMSRLKDMNTSPHTFILVDTTFSKEALALAKDCKVPVEEYLAPPTRTEGPSVFSLTDAYLSRDKKGSWLKFAEVLRSGAAPEEVHGALFWAIKSLWLVVGGESAEELGMKPFVYQKMKRAGGAWKREEVRQRLLSLTTLLEETRKTGGDLAVSLEQFVLKN